MTMDIDELKIQIQEHESLCEGYVETIEELYNQYHSDDTKGVLSYSLTILEDYQKLIDLVLPFIDSLL